MAPSYSKLKWSLSSVPATALNASSRQILDRLNQYMLLPSPKGHARDSRGLAALMSFQWHEAKPLEGSAAKILEAWETRPGSTLDKLIGYLEDMDRHDVIQILIPTLERDVEKYKESLVKVGEENDVAEHQETPVQVDGGNDVAEYQETPVQVDEGNDVAENQETPVQVDEVSTGLTSRALTRHDLGGKVFTEFDALLAYDDDDSFEAFEIAQHLESPSVGLKLLIRARDLLAGTFEFETLLELMMNRCRHIVMILTPNFVRNPTLEFQVNFAAKLGIVFTEFDALLAYDDDDSFEAFEIAQHLESPSVGLKLLIRARDLLAGTFEFETLLELMMNRCRHIVMILTPNFVRNPTLEFQVNFAAKLGIERNERILIPVIVKTCAMPPVLKGMTPIDLTKKYSQRWLWENLVNSILPKGRAPFSLPPLQGVPLNIVNTIPNSVPSVPEDID